MKLFKIIELFLNVKYYCPWYSFCYIFNSVLFTNLSNMFLYFWTFNCIYRLKWLVMPPWLYWFLFAWNILVCKICREKMSAAFSFLRVSSSQCQNTYLNRRIRSVSINILALLYRIYTHSCPVAYACHPTFIHNDFRWQKKNITILLFFSFSGDRWCSPQLTPHTRITEYAYSPLAHNYNTHSRCTTRA